MEPTSRKILIVAPSWVGDMVMAQTLFKILKNQNPMDAEDKPRHVETLEVCIDVLAPAWCESLLRFMPEVSHIITMPLGHGQFDLKQRYQIGKSLKKNAYDEAIVLPNSWKSALIPFFARIPIRRGWLGEWRYGLLTEIRRLDKTRYPKMIERFAALAFPARHTLPNALPYPALQLENAEIQATVQKFGLVLDKPVLALCPGAEYGPAKRWPPEYFATVAAEKIQSGWQVWLFGSQKDTEIAQRIQTNLGKDRAAACVNLVGRTHLEEAVRLLSQSTVVVSNDSGLMHVAAALQKPLVVIYGSSDPRFTPPLCKSVSILKLDLPCSPCFQRECPLIHMNCLKQLHPEEVLRAINTLSEKEAP